MPRKPSKREREKYALLAGPVVEMHATGKPINRAINGADTVIGVINRVPGQPNMPRLPRNPIRMPKL